MQLVALCNRDKIGHEQLRQLLNLKGKDTMLLILGGVTLPADISYSAKIYSITGRFDDHYVARLLEDRSTFVESKVRYIGYNWYIAGVGGRDPIANINAIKRALKEILQTSTEVKIALVAYFCPYKKCDRSILGGRRGLQELHEIIDHYPVKVLISCECGPGIIEHGDKILICLGGGNCIGFIDISNDSLPSKLSCGENTPWNRP